MMYHVNESHILTHWSLETLIKKTKNGFAFLLLQKGVVPDEQTDEMPENLSDDEIIELFS